MKKRILSFMLAIALVLTNMPSTLAFANNELTSTSNTLDGQLFEMDGGTIVGYKDTSATSIVIPEEINGVRVTNIKDFVFDANVYANLKEITILGENTVIGEKSFGYQVNGNGVYNRVNDFCIWGKDNSYAKNYALENAIKFEKVATSISPIVSSEKNLNNCFVGGSSIYMTTIVDKEDVFLDENETSKDVVWTSENPDLVSVSQYEWSQNQNGEWECTAQVNVLSTPSSGTTCKIYVDTRSGLHQEITLTLRIPATQVSLDMNVYYPVKIMDGEGEEATEITIYKKMKLPETAIEGNNIYLERGWYLESFICRSSSDSVDDKSHVFLEQNQSVIGEIEDLMLDPRNEESIVKARLVSEIGTSKLVVATDSGQLSKSYNVNVLSASEKISIFIDETEIGGLVNVIKGYIGKLSIEMEPGDSTDKITWTSSNEKIVKISNDGTITTTDFGRAELVGRVEASKTGKPAKTIRIVFIVGDKIKFNDMIFVDSPTSTTSITKLNLLAGDEKQLYLYDPKCLDSNKFPNEKVEWSSSNINIANVDENGLITTSETEGGKVIITAKSESGVTRTLELNVYVAATNIDLEKTAYQKPMGQIIEIPYIVGPETSNEFVNWISDDASAVQVVSNEKGPNDDGLYTLKLKVLKVTNGFVNINGKTVVSGVSSQVQVKGLTPIYAEKLSIKPSGYIKEVKNDAGNIVYCVQKDSTITLEASVFPSNSNDSFKWEVSSLDVENLEDLENYIEWNSNGLTASIVIKGNIDVEVKCVSSSGTFTICNLRGISPATNVDISIEDNVNVGKVQVPVGQKLNIYAMIDSESTDTVTWTLAKKTDPNNILKRWEDCKKVGDEGYFYYPDKMFNEPGDYIVRATSESGVYREVEINAVVYIESFDFVKDGKPIKELVVSKGKTTTVSIENISPSNASNSLFSWAENNGYVSLKVSKDTKSVEITGLCDGETDLIVTTNAGVTYSLPIVVVIPAETILIGGQENAKDILVHPGQESISITATLGPVGTNDVLEWIVDKEGIVSIEMEESFEETHTALITAIKEGEVVLTLRTSSGVENKVKIVSKAIDISNATAYVSPVEYTGKPQEVYLDEISIDGYTLEENVDYKIVGYKNNVNVGIAQIIIEGIGNYSGTLTLNFEIYKKESYFDIEYKEVHTFNGKNICPSVVVKDTNDDGEKITLIKDVDYTITYEKNCKNIGSYTFIITMKGNYSGVETGYYEIIPKSIKGVTIKDSNKKTVTTLPNKEYTGSSITQKFYLYDGSYKLVENVDYYVEYSKNKNVGKASVTIKGLGNYNEESKKVVYFTITPYSLANVKIAAISKKTYNGKYQKPSLKVSRVVNGKTKYLTVGSDYKVVYKNNKLTGKATVTITPGINKNYSSSKSTSFVIVPKTVTGLKQSFATPTSVTLTWSKLDGSISGYDIYRYDTSKKKYTLVQTTTKNSAIISKLKDGSDYYYVVKGFKKVGKTKYYGNASSKIKTMTSSKVPTIKTTSQSKGKVTLSWNTCKGANRYYVYYSTNGGKTYKKVGDTNKLKYTISTKFKKGTKVSLKICSVRNIGSKKYVSKYSTVKKITIK